MQIKLLGSIVENIVGKQATQIVDLLFGKKNVNEFNIAKKLKLTINQTRTMLYKLSDAGIVSFIRKKDKRKGWYTYFWTLDTLKSLELLEQKIKEEIQNLQNQIKSRETKRYYLCKTCHVEVSEETALLNEFVCHECGQVYELNTDTKIINELNSKINKLSKELFSIQEELMKIREEDAKKIRRADVREKKKKADIRKIRMKKLKKIRKKAVKKKKKI